MNRLFLKSIMLILLYLIDYGIIIKLLTIHMG